MEDLTGLLGERYMLTLPLDQARFDALAVRPTLPASVRKRLLTLVASGTHFMTILLGRLDLTSDELAVLARSPGVDVEEAQRIVRHPSCKGLALGELAVVDLRRAVRRAATGLGQPRRSQQVLGVLRNSGTPGRVASIMVDKDLSVDPREIGAVVDGVTSHPAALEAFLSLSRDWYGTGWELLECCQNLDD